MSEYREPLISVYVPCYNVEPYVEECVRSIMEQDYKNLEILLIDNMSTDKTTEILERLSEEDERICLAYCVRRGLSAVRNMAYNYCHGQWIMEVDGDDAVPSDAVRKLFETAVMENCRMSCGGYYLVGDTIDHDHPVNMKKAVPDTTEQVQEYFLKEGRNRNQTWGKLYRRDVLAGITYPEGRIYEDIPVQPLIIEKAEGCAVFDEPVYYYRVRGGSLTNEADFMRQLDGLNFRLDNCSFFEQHYPRLTPLAYDCVLEFAFFLMGRMADTAEKENEECFNIVVKTALESSKKAAKSGLKMKAALFLIKRDPYLAAHFFKKFSENKNKTKQ